MLLCWQVLSSQSYGFSSSLQKWQLDHKEGWAPKNWCFLIVVLEKTLSPLDCKEIKPVNSEGNQPWIFIGRTDGEAPILPSPNEKRRLIGKDPDAWKNWRQKKRVAEIEMVRQHHRLKGHALIWANSGSSDGQGSLACYSSWDMT